MLAINPLVSGSRGITGCPRALADGVTGTHSGNNGCGYFPGSREVCITSKTTNKDIWVQGLFLIHLNIPSCQRTEDVSNSNM